MALNILYVGLNSFPIGLAPVQRQILISKGLLAITNKCKVICRYGIHNKSIEVLKEGLYEGIQYKYCSSIYRNSNFIIRNFNKFLGIIRELGVLITSKEKNHINVILSVRTSLFNTLFYAIVAKLMGYKYIIDINEQPSAISYNKLDYLFSKIYESIIPYISDGIIIISKYLEQFYNSKKHNVKLIRIPVICDIKKINSFTNDKRSEKYFLYCASAAYSEVAKFVIDAFTPLTSNLDLKLILILSGSETEIDKVWNYIEQKKLLNQVAIYSKLDYKTLIEKFKGAIGLLIPLRETIQDRARFPHKIAEYSCCKVPIVTNNWGEIRYYFENNETALIASHYEVLEYTNLMKLLLENKHNAKISENAYNLAYRLFDFKQNGFKLQNFLKNL